MPPSARVRTFGSTVGRAVDRGELPADLNLELALDFLLAPIHVVAERAPN
ncbi:TetR/AcrR family transcriptional regulator C-terminal ligand-binding domain-containing protein [Nocardia huaxiensis]|nr:TetR/AcrR family transcriptional regulator C-terminal ligand-binding domain-containing protein [Nocardia huaxiensis]UFS96626.1 TetR/AcrR family transcriptional regulator C-terminal ligand-binding domain-containing protein [Nocardia huaxiensis]